jgi:hypothetical protein
MRRYRDRSDGYAMSAEGTDIKLLLGHLSGTLDSLVKTVDQEHAELEDERREYRDYREDVRKALASLKEGVDKIPAMIVTLNDHAEDIQEFKNLRNRFGGAIVVLTVAWSLLIAAAIYFKDFILHLGKAT